MREENTKYIDQLRKTLPEWCSATDLQNVIGSPAHLRTEWELGRLANPHWRRGDVLDHVRAYGMDYPTTVFKQQTEEFPLNPEEE